MYNSLTMRTDLSTIGAALAGTRTASLTAANVEMIRSLTRDGSVNGKPTLDDAKVKAVMGVRTDEYWRHICGGNSVSKTLIQMMGWWA